MLEGLRGRRRRDCGSDSVVLKLILAAGSSHPYRHVTCLPIRYQQTFTPTDLCCSSLSIIDYRISISSRPNTDPVNFYFVSFIIFYLFFFPTLSSDLEVKSRSQFFSNYISSRIYETRDTCQ